MKAFRPIRYFIFLSGAILCCAFLYLANKTITASDEQGCRSITMWPSYARVTGFDQSHTRLARKYTLYLYREQGLDPRPDKMNEGFDSLKGFPVLFIPGNAGSHKQIRSIASKASNLFFNSGYNFNEGTTHLDFFAAYFNEDFTAFHGRTLLDQAEYLNEAVKYILSLYAGNKKPPKEIIVIGHSMGGFVARTMLTLPNYVESSIKTILTLSTPHTNPPLNFDGEIVRIYSAVNDFWSKDPKKDPVVARRLKDVNIVSIAGGLLDNLVPGDFISLNKFTPKSVSVFTSGIEGVWTSIDHQAIVWCDQFRTLVAHVLMEIVDNMFAKKRTANDRMVTFKRYFLSVFASEYRVNREPKETIDKSELTNKNAYPVDKDKGDVKILSEDELDIYTCVKDTCIKAQYEAFLLPQSKGDTESIEDSTIGGETLPFHYTVIPSTIDSIYIKNDDKLIFYSQADVEAVSLSQSIFRLLFGVTVEIPKGHTVVSNILTFNGLITYKITFDGIEEKEFSPFLGQFVVSRNKDRPVEETKFHINLQDSKSINVHFHDKGPFTDMSSLEGGTGNLGVWTMKGFNMKVKIDLFHSLKFFVIRYRLSVIPFALLWNLLVFICQLYTFETTGKYQPFLQVSGSLVNWKSGLVFVLFNAVCYILFSPKLSLVAGLVRSLDPVNWLLTRPSHSLFLGIQNAFWASSILMILAISINTLLAAVINLGAKYVGRIPSVNKSDKARIGINVALLLSVAIYLPYQLVYVVCFIVQLVKLGRKTNTEYNFNFSVLMVMIWLIPINVPTIIVFVHNTVVNMLIPFSSHHNILSILPIMVFSNLDLKMPAMKSATSKFLWFYMVYYAVYCALFGSVHAFWLYHLFNFMVVVVLVLQYEAKDPALQWTWGKLKD